jgi:sirohydrochlorin ferrochelatase
VICSAERVPPKSSVVSVRKTARSGRSTLLAVAHGSRDPEGASVVESLLRRVAGLHPDLLVRTAYLQAAPPSLEELLAEVSWPAVVVPLLLAPGYHSTVDIPAAVGDRKDVRIAPVLGPDPLLSEALADRLGDRGWHARVDDAVVLAAAGSSDPVAAAAVVAQAESLERFLGVPVTVGYGSAQRPTVAEAVLTARTAGAGRVAVASHLLAPGWFQRRLAGVGADLVTEPLGDHPSVARLVLVRWLEADSIG